MRSKMLPLILVAILAVLIAVGLIYQQKMKNAPETSPTETQIAAQPSASPAPSSSPALQASPAPVLSTSPAPSNLPLAGNVDLTVDSNGLSKTTVAITTSQGLIKFKFYPQDAPNTVQRIIQLIQQGFYNGLTFHRVVPNFVIQGGDPTGTGAGGSGQKLKAEFNNRRHIEGTMAMARASDPDSADSQFYISLTTLPHLDRSYTVFGQVIEGMDVVRKIQKGDKMLSFKIE